jgi:hypothetical protein
MYKYETHLHTSPVSKCGSYSVRTNLEFYKSIGYDGVFLTNHFLDANIGGDRSRPYKEQIEFYFTDIEEGERIADEVGIKFFWGVESSYLGTDFLIYGLDKKWFLAHPEIMDMKKSEELPFLASHGALVIQAHPYRQDRHIDHIRLFPHCIEGVETVNACRTELENRMADIFADAYGFVKTAGSDNHIASRLTHLAGMESDTPLVDEADFIRRVRNREMKIFTLDI